MTRYLRKGTEKWYFALTVASLDAPTVANLASATNLTPDLGVIAGFTFQNNPAMTPDMDSTFTSQIEGEDTTEQSALTFWEDDASNPIRTALAKGTSGYVVIFPYGIGGAAPIAGDECEVWPAKVTANTRLHTVDNEGAQYRIDFALTDEPDQDATIAA